LSYKQIEPVLRPP